MVRAALPATGGMPDVLEVGCGTGVFAARLVEELPGIALLAVDASYRMVELTRERGVPAQVQDVQHLLAPDAAYDVVLAISMLYHVPDLDRGLAELRRVLRPGGSLIAVTVSDDHTGDLRRDAGGQAVAVPFSRENGEAGLRRHFDTVQRTDLETRAYFPDRAAALAYLTTLDDGVLVVTARGRLAARVRRPPDGVRCELAAAPRARSASAASACEPGRSRSERAPGDRPRGRDDCAGASAASQAPASG